MREPIPEVFPDIVITKLDKGATFSPSKPTLYKCFVDDIFTRRKTNLPDELLKFFNLHQSITLICEINPG